MRLRGLVAPFPGVFFRRSVAYWVLLYLLFVALALAAAAMAGRAVDPAALIPGSKPLIPLLAGGLGMIEARRRDEDLFLANLGYGWMVLAAYLTLPAAALEALFTVAR